MSKGRSRLKESNTFSRSDNRGIFDFLLRRKFVWLFKRRGFLAQMSKMRALKAEVYMTQNTYLMG